MAAREAVFVHGNPLRQDFRPGSAVLGGEVQVVGDSVLIPHSDIPANQLGSADAGGGVYEVTADGVMASGERVWWNNTTKKVTKTAGANKIIGYLADGTSASGDGQKVRIRHNPTGVDSTS